MTEQPTGLKDQPKAAPADVPPNVALQPAVDAPEGLRWVRNVAVLGLLFTEIGLGLPFIALLLQIGVGIYGAWLFGLSLLLLVVGTILTYISFVRRNDAENPRRVLTFNIISFVMQAIIIAVLVSVTVFVRQQGLM